MSINHMYDLKKVNCTYKKKKDGFLKLNMQQSASKEASKMLRVTF
jgi:hypothetical protein